jgi:hypothetical protein
MNGFETAADHSKEWNLPLLHDPHGIRNFHLSVTHRQVLLLEGVQQLKHSLNYKNCCQPIFCLSLLQEDASPYFLGIYKQKYR